MLSRAHELPILPNDQCRKVTVNDTVELLLHVEKVIDDVFNTISSRISGNYHS